MVRAEKVTLRLIGYWQGPMAQDWPDVHDFVDPDWDAEEREAVGEYLATGVVFRGFGGVSTCRFCGEPNGALELTDGQWYWPDGLQHYVTEHDVRLPNAFVSYVLARMDELEVVERDVDWWRSQSPAKDADGT
ncbi:hypothetical protein [Kribbella sp. NPDC051770]|uniref:hypothetical protein n=1 Tax=Kribbella sp. NPDC051770 TaxID=3155413 RepID=UPI003439B6BE